MSLQMYNCVTYNTHCARCAKVFSHLTSTQTSSFTESDLTNSHFSYPVILTRSFSQNERSRIPVPGKPFLERYMKEYIGIHSPRVYEAQLSPLPLPGAEGNGEDRFEVWFMIDFPLEMAWMSADTQPLGSTHPLGSKERKVMRIMQGLFDGVGGGLVSSWTIRVPLPGKCLNRQRLAFFEGLRPVVGRSLFYRPWRC